MVWSFCIGALMSTAMAADMLVETQGVFGRGIAVPEDLHWAETLVDSEQWDDALIAWQGLALSRNDADAALWAIVSAVQGGDQESAQAATYLAMELPGYDPRILLAAAWLLNESGEHRDAAKLVRSYPVNAPDSEGATILRMRALMMAGKHRKALRVRRQALQDGASDAWFWLELGLEDAWRERGDPTAHLQQSIRSRNAGPTHYRILAQYLMDVDQVEQGLRTGLDGLRRFPTSVELSIAMLEMTRFGAGRQALTDLLEDEPTDATARAVLGMVLFADGAPADAAVNLAVAVQGGQDQPAMYRMLAEAHMAAAQSADAWDALVLGVEQHPDESNLWRTLYRVSYTDSRQGEALALTEAAWQRGVQRDFLVDFAYQTASDIDELELALQWSDRGLGLSGRQWEGLAQHALALTRLGRGQEALVTYEEALQLRPQEPQLLNNLAWLLLEPGEGIEPDVERAQALAEAAVRHAEEPHPAYLDTLARVLWEKGDRVHAIELQRQAVDLAPDNEEIRNTLQQYETSE